jgi:hypothetical protein
MELHARLVHAEAGLRVVEVRATQGDIPLGSALAEATSAQEAEDLAISRLLGRLEGPAHADAESPAPSRALLRRGSSGPGDGDAAPSRARAAPLTQGTTPSVRVERRNPEPDVGPAIAGREPDPASSSAEPPAAEAAAATQPSTPHVPSASEALDGGVPRAQSDPQEEPPADPEDWSQELTAIDLQLRRLDWHREQEGIYLARAFGHPSRSRLTRYSDLRAYLMALETLERGSDPAVASVPLRRTELLAQGDALLAQLGWSAEQGRAFLERELNRISRQQLSDVQLLEFNMLLEGELLAPAAQQEAQR